VNSHYQPLSYASIKQIFAGLLDQSSSKRKKDISFLQNFSVPEDHPERNKILLGLAVYLTEKIASEYRLSSPEGSELFKKLKSEILNRPGNIMDEREQLICLNHFYQYAKQKKLDLTHEKYKDSQKLKNEFRFIGDRILGRIPEIRAALNPRPTYKNLLNEFNQSYQFYAMDLEKRYTNPNYTHKQYELLLRIMNDPSADAIFLECAGVQSTDDPEFLRTKQSVISGVALNIMAHIEIEYQTSLFGSLSAGYISRSPENSHLYRLCQKILNVARSTDVPDIHKLSYLGDASEFLDTLKNEKCGEKALEKLKSYETGKNWLWQVTYFSDATDFLDQTSNKMEQALKSKDFLQRCFKSLSNAAFLGSIGFGCWQMAGMYGFVEKKLVKEIGKLIARGTASIFGTGIVGNFIRGQIPVKTIINYPVTLVQKMAGTPFPKKPKERISERTATKRFDRQLKKEITAQLSGNMDKQIERDQEWFRTLLELPTMIPPEARSRLRKALIDDSTLMAEEEQKVESSATLSPAV